MSGSFTERLGWTFVHFLWQGVAIGAIAALVLVVLRRRGAEARYLAGVLGLAALVLAPVITFLTIADLRPLASGTAIAPPAVAQAGTGAWIVPALAWFWLAGAGLMQARSLLLLARARRLVTRDTTAPPTEWVRRLASMSERVGVRRAVRLLQSARVTGPVVVGWLRPAILVPAEVFTGLTRGQLDAVLAHELAHVRRHDFLINLLQGVAEAALFFHPVVWWLSARVREEREFCCDDLAVRAGGDRVVFARGLAALDSLSASTRVAPAVAARGGPLMKRIERLVRAETTPSLRSVSAGVPLVLLGVLVGLVPAAGGALGVAGDDEKAKKLHVEWILAHDDATTAKHSLKLVMSKLSEAERTAVKELHAAGMSEAELLEALSGSASGDQVKRVIAELSARQESQAAAAKVDELEAKVRHLELKAKLKAAKKKLGALVEAGEMTDAQAKEKLEAIHRKLAHAQATGRFDAREAAPASEPAVREEAKRHAEHVEKMMRKIELALKDGTLTKEQAHAKMKALKESLRR